jgi:hypothetical protein
MGIISVVLPFLPRIISLVSLDFSAIFRNYFWLLQRVEHLDIKIARDFIHINLFSIAPFKLWR